ncbi:MAG: hypothetical protein LBV54_08010, partial [Puniceicoccales bacterium]|nr:hypothetical protein [Puniceicoccales bacterium]
GLVLFGSKDELAPEHQANIVLPPNVVFKGNKAGKSGSVIYNNGGTIIFSNGKQIEHVEILKNSVIHLCYEKLSEYNQGKELRFLLRIVFEDGQVAYFTNGEAIVAQKAGTVLMRPGKGYFSAKIECAGKVKEAVVDYGIRSKHFSAGVLNKKNDGKPLFYALKFNDAD